MGDKTILPSLKSRKAPSTPSKRRSQQGGQVAAAYTTPYTFNSCKYHMIYVYNNSILCIVWYIYLPHNKPLQQQHIPHNIPLQQQHIPYNIPLQQPQIPHNIPS